MARAWRKPRHSQAGIGMLFMENGRLLNIAAVGKIVYNCGNVPTLSAQAVSIPSPISGEATASNLRTHKIDAFDIRDTK